MSSITLGPYSRSGVAVVNYRTQFLKKWGSRSVLLYEKEENGYMISNSFTCANEMKLRKDVSDLVLSMCHLFLLGGSTSLKNVKEVDGELKIVRYDSSSHPKDSSFFYLDKSPCKNVRNKLLSVYENVSRELSRLFSEHLDDVIKARLVFCITNLQKNALVSPGKNLISSAPFKEEKFDRKIGQMMWKGHIQCKTYSGHSYLNMKEALNKAISEKDLTKCIVIVTELYRLKEVGGETSVVSLFNWLIQLFVESLYYIHPADCIFAIKNHHFFSSNYPLEWLICMLTLIVSYGEKNGNFSIPHEKPGLTKKRKFLTKEGKTFSKRMDVWEQFDSLSKPEHFSNEVRDLLVEMEFVHENSVFYELAVKLIDCSFECKLNIEDYIGQWKNDPRCIEYLETLYNGEYVLEI